MSRGPVNRASLRTSVQRQQPRERGIIGLNVFMRSWYVRRHRARKPFEMIVKMDHPRPERRPVTDTEPLLLTRDGAVATLTINRQDRLNTLTYAMFAALPQVLAEAAALPGLRALVLRGAGTRAFSAGADISEFGTTRTTREQASAYDDAVLAAEEAVAAFPLPTIAAVHGHCYGGGCGSGHRLRHALRRAGRPVRHHPRQARHRLPAARHQAPGGPGRPVPRQDHPDVRRGLQRSAGAVLRPGRRGVRRPGGA